MTKSKCQINAKNSSPKYDMNHNMFSFDIEHWDFLPAVGRHLSFEL